MSALAFFNGNLGAHLDASTTGAIGVFDALAPKNQATGWKVGAFHKLHQVFGSCLGIVDQVQCGVDDLAQIVWGDARGHSHRNALAAIDQQVGESCRQHNGFFGGAVVGGNEINRVFVNVSQQLHG